MELAELVRGAQEAMDRGNYHLAARACSHVLESFPDCMSAHRILGEALLERGETQPAIGHFERTLALDPLSVVARLGLGVAAEEHKGPGLAYAHYLHAWEINPALDQVRGQLVRLRAQLGSQDRLHPTRAGLAGIHARSGQLGRAAAEWRAILAVDPESVRARTSLADVLWRAGDDAGAAAICRELLNTAPDNARALAILADIEKRVGAPSAGDWVNRYRAIDPMGEIVQVIGELREGVDLSFLMPEGPTVPDFDFDAVAAEGPPTGAAAGAPAAPSLAASHVAAPDLWDNLVRDLQQDATEAAEPDAAGLLPFSWSDDGSVIDLGSAVEPFSLEGLEDLDQFGTAPAISEIDLPALARDSAVAGAATPTRSDHLAAIREPEPVVASAAPAAAPLPVPAAPAASNPFETADGRVDLTIGWDEIDRALQAATPSEGNHAGYEDLLAELDAGGLAPFAADDAGASNHAWEPFSADEFDAPSPATVLAQPPVPALADEVIGIAPAAMPWGSDHEPSAVPDDWVDIDEDLIASIPSPQPSGYTELLRHVDSEALVPLAAIEQVEVDPFANPDASGEPLDIEDLLTVTSRDGTSELGPVEASAAPPLVAPNEAPAGAMDDVALGANAFRWPDEPLATTADDGVLGIGDDLGGIAPFSFDELILGGEAIGTPSGLDDFSDLQDVFAPAPSVAESGPEPVVAASAAELEPAPADAPAFGWADSESPPEVPTAEAAPSAARVGAEAIRWPTMVGHTSDLIDRESAGLFDRLRAAKQTLVAQGGLVVRGSLVPVASAGPTPRSDGDGAGQKITARPRLAAVDGEPVASPVPASNGFDLTAMRVRLIESESAAAEIASTLEAALARGDADPLALRVLGEAYLRLGRTEQAAAQFRQAMLARRRVR